jgi:hypothetical protein
MLHTHSCHNHQNVVHHNVTADEQLDGAALSGQIAADAPCWWTMFIRILAGTTTIHDWTKGQASYTFSNRGWSGPRAKQAV